MRDGEIVETGPVDDIFYRPQHGYTKALLDAMPRLDRPKPSIRSRAAERREPILEVEDLEVHFPIRDGGLAQPRNCARSMA